MSRGGGWRETDLEAFAANEAELWRDLVRRGRGRVVEEQGLLLSTGPSPYLRAALRTDHRLAAGEVLERAVAFFGDDPFSITVTRPDEADLAAVCEAAGFTSGWSEEHMAIDTPPPLVAPAAGVTIHDVVDADDVADFRRVASEGNDDDVERERAHIAYERPESVLAPHIRALVARDIHGDALASAMTLASHGVAGIFWVATLPRARRRGLADALTRRAVHAAFVDLRASAVWLGASPAGRRLYERMGFVPLGRSTVEYDRPETRR